MLGIVNTPKIIVLNSVIVWEIYEPKEFSFTFDRIQILTAIKDLKDSMLQYCSLEEWQKTMHLGIRTQIISYAKALYTYIKA